MWSSPSQEGVATARLRFVPGGWRRRSGARQHSGQLLRRSRAPHRPSAAGTGGTRAAQRSAAARPQCRILSRHNLEGANSALLCSARLRHRAPLRTKSWGSSVPCLPFAGSPVARISCDVQQPGQLQGRVLGSECPE